MKTGNIIQEVYLIELRDKTKEKKLTGFVRKENELFINEKWEDSYGNFYNKTYHKKNKYIIFSKNGLLHNTKGPAVIKTNGTTEWWYENIQVAVACENKNLRQFSVYTPVDEELISGPLVSLDLMTVLRAKESLEKKIGHDVGFKLKNNTGAVNNDLRVKKPKT